MSCLSAVFLVCCNIRINFYCESFCCGYSVLFLSIDQLNFIVSEAGLLSGCAKYFEGAVMSLVRIPLNTNIPVASFAAWTELPNCVNTVSSIVKIYFFTVRF